MKVVADVNIVPVGLQNADFPIYFGTLGKAVDMSGLEYALQVHGLNLCKCRRRPNGSSTCMLSRDSQPVCWLGGQLDDIFATAKSATKSLYSSFPELDHMVTFMCIHCFSQEGLENIGVESEKNLTLSGFLGKMNSEFMKR